MSDLISRQSVIDLWNKYHSTIAVDAICFDKELKALPSAFLPIKKKCQICPHCDNCDVNDDGELASTWISCSEKLPKEKELVLAQTYEGCQYIMELAFDYSNEEDEPVPYWKTFEESVEWEADYVVAWMPLPEPYKGERSE